MKGVYFTGCQVLLVTDGLKGLQYRVWTLVGIRVVIGGFWRLGFMDGMC